MNLTPVTLYPELKKYSSAKIRSGTGSVNYDRNLQLLTIKTENDAISFTYNGDQLHSGDLVRYTLVDDQILLERLVSSSGNTGQSDNFIPHQPSSLDEIFSFIDFALQNTDQILKHEQLIKKLSTVLELLSNSSLGIDTDAIQNIISLLNAENTDESDSLNKLSGFLLLLQKDISQFKTCYRNELIRLPNDGLCDMVCCIDHLKSVLSNSNIPKESIELLFQQLLSTGNQYVNIFLSDKSTFATGLDFEKLLYRLSSLKFESPQLQNVNINILESILKSRSLIDISSLNNLDKLLQSQSDSFKPAIPSTITQTKLHQWLITALDYQTIKNELCSRFPGTIPELLALTKRVSDQLPSPEKFGITAPLLHQLNNKADLIPSVINNLGFNFEREIVENGVTSLNQASLKAKIYESINKLDTENMVRKLNSLNKAHYDILSFINNLPADIKKSDILHILTTIKATLSSIEIAQNSLEGNYSSKQDVKQTTNNSYQNASENINQKQKTPFLLNDLKESFYSLEKAVQSLQAPKLSESLALTIKLIGDCRKIAEQLISRDNNFNQTQISISNNQFAKIEDDLSSFSNDAGPGEAFLKKISQRLDIEKVLNSFESFQLLSKEVKTSEGTQQVLAIPMQVGNEWTELNIRFIKKGNAQKKKHQKHFRIELNVAPTKLGSISVQMDYEVKKSFSLNIVFDKKQTHQWFVQNSAVLGKAISSLGLPLQSFILNTVAPQKKSSDESFHTNRIIDFKV